MCENEPLAENFKLKKYSLIRCLLLAHYFDVKFHDFRTLL